MPQLLRACKLRMLFLVGDGLSGGDQIFQI
jgi:hypothetical protein